MDRKICSGAIVFLLFCAICHAGINVPGTITPQTTNGINWTQIHNIGGTNLNWTDVRVFATSHGGDHSGINWQSLGV